jgi:hypothetical protein
MYLLLAFERFETKGGRVKKIKYRRHIPSDNDKA